MILRVEKTKKTAHNKFKDINGIQKATEDDLNTVLKIKVAIFLIFSLILFFTLCFKFDNTYSKMNYFKSLSIIYISIITIGSNYNFMIIS